MACSAVAKAGLNSLAVCVAFNIVRAVSVHPPVVCAGCSALAREGVHSFVMCVPFNAVHRTGVRPLLVCGVKCKYKERCLLSCDVRAV